MKPCWPAFDNHMKRNPCIAMCCLVLLAACQTASLTATPTPPPTATPTAVTVVTREKAIELAIGMCRVPHLALVGEPENVRARLMPLRQAVDLTKSLGNGGMFSQSLDSRVWLVEVDGLLQIVGGPMYVLTPTPIGWTGTIAVRPAPKPFRGTCTVILDADTGDMLIVYG